MLCLSLFCWNLEAAVFTFSGGSSSSPYKIRNSKRKISLRTFMKEKRLLLVRPRAAQEPKPKIDIDSYATLPNTNFFVAAWFFFFIVQKCLYWLDIFLSWGLCLKFGNSFWKQYHWHGICEIYCICLFVNYIRSWSAFFFLIFLYHSNNKN